MDAQNMFAGMLPPEAAPFLLLLLAWSFVWKGLALWHSARRTDTVWFVVFLFVNTVGILEIIYLFAFARRTMGNLFSKSSGH
jgi:hypothetical protein